LGCSIKVPQVAIKGNRHHKIVLSESLNGREYMESEAGWTWQAILKSSKIADYQQKEVFAHYKF